MIWHRALQLIGAVLALQTIQVPAPPRGFSPTQADVVLDSAHVLSPEAVERINRVAFDVHAKSGGELTVVTLPDLGGRDVADVALQILRQWGLGKAAPVGNRTRNAGAVILIVPKETSADGRGHVRVETGRGVEGFITDAEAGDILREAIPDFQRRDYSAGSELMAQRVGQKFADEFGFTLDTALAPRGAVPGDAYEPRRGRGGLSPAMLFALFVIAMILLSSLSGRRRGRGGCGGCLPIFIPMGGGGWGGGGGGYRGGGGWGGGGFGGGGGGFGGFGGGGGGSGGGASGSW